MKAEYVNPFITATSEVFKTMVGIEPERGQLYVKADEKLSYDISGVIGLAGQASGFVIISMSERLAFKVLENFLGETKTEVDDDVMDAIGEILNMIAGGAKQIFSKNGIRFKISIPNVVVGKDHKVGKQKNVQCLGMSFNVGDDSFVIEVALNEGG
ncbi:MAG: chemotaxis protein CheX [Denitrovibrio sp.]|nr:MAG: chemotaxis protein CheX [Denitrovibrio sp.]